MSDAITELCALLESAGLQLRLYGVPVDERELRAAVTASSLRRMGGVRLRYRVLHVQHWRPLPGTGRRTPCATTLHEQEGW